MADLTSLDKIKIEKLFNMESGYVMDFSNRTFQEFIASNVNRDIYDEKYNSGTGSKANRLRAFWSIESNHLTGKLLKALLEYWKYSKESNEIKIPETMKANYNDCIQISERLIKDTAIEDSEILDLNSFDKDFLTLARNIKESLDKNEPEIALDRLHTYTTKYIKSLLKKYAIETNKDKPLHSMFGEYVKHLKNNHLIESEMTERILKTSISILEAFSEVRNNRTFAHDNTLLNHRESVLIVGNIINTVKFIYSMEENLNKLNQDENDSVF